MRLISAEPLKSQAILFPIGDSQVGLTLVQRGDILYADVYLDGRCICQGVPCLNGNRIIHYKYLGFPGDLFFVDTLGNSDPNYSGIGSRYLLYHLSEDENVQ